MGNPAKVTKDITDEMAINFQKAPKYYKELAQRYIHSLKLIEK